MHIDHTAFFNGYRAAYGKLSQGVVSGLELLGRNMESDPELKNLQWAAYMLATVKHECSDTWQPTMERLATSNDAVLMDLRSFRPANQGCIFELARLLDLVDLRRVVFLTDGTTDRGFLDATLQDMWRRLDASSPNGTNRAPAARLFPVTTHSARELRALLRLMMSRPAAAAE